MIRVSAQVCLISCRAKEGGGYQYRYSWTTPPGLNQWWKIADIRHLDKIRHALQNANYLEHMKMDLDGTEWRIVDVANIILKATWF